MSGLSVTGEAAAEEKKEVGEAPKDEEGAGTLAVLSTEPAPSAALAK